ncbi:hypothetical protein BEN44_20100 [Leptospira interrogans serovar Ricardi]|nr:hypothetical protein [Leptospira interrogans serovar Ricardi]
MCFVTRFAGRRIVCYQYSCRLIHHYMEKYSDRLMDFADASLVSLSEIYEIKDILTLDSDFLFYKTKKGKALNILNSEMIKY